MKYPCRQCEYQATRKEKLDWHKRSVHEGIKYPCRKYGYQATTKESLDRHKRSVHEGIKYPYGHGSIKQHKKEV